jgi:hypothetical protein
MTADGTPVLTTGYDTTVCDIRRGIRILDKMVEPPYLLTIRRLFYFVIISLSKLLFHK